MKNIKTRHIISILFLMICLPAVYGQVGVNTVNPTAVLDVNGNLRVREIIESTSTEDIHLVIDSDGFVKNSLIAATLLRGNLNSDFTSGTEIKIYQVTDFNVVEGDLDQIDAPNGIFTPKISGIYSIETTLTLAGTQTLVGTVQNVICGVVDKSTGEWIMRFSIPAQEIDYVGLDSPVGTTYTFTGAVNLVAGKQYYFGISRLVKIIAKPSGTTGSGLGTYLSVILLKSND